MCGISGIANLNGTQVPQEQIQRLTDSLVHRGPDGEGIWFNKNRNVAFGHRRLSIIDLSEKASQPMEYDNGRYWITYNGEIYNYLELKKELVDSGYYFNTTSDTEVILASFDKWGINMLNRFNGMWAFAIFDGDKNTLLISRDRYGVKPLYYYYNNSILAFASEVKSLYKTFNSDLRYDETVLKDIARGSFYYHATERTFIKEIRALPAGYNLLLANGKPEIKRWYVLKSINIPTDFTEQSIMLKELLIDSCYKRLRSDVPVATCLSGGLDSGTITSLLNLDREKRTSYTHLCFTASFPNSAIDESVSAKKLANQINSKLDLLEIYSPSVDELEHAMEKCDGPMHSLAFFPILSLYKYISDKGIKVTLDGQGPDEMLGGYRPLSEALDTAIVQKKIWEFIDYYKIYSSQGESEQFSSKRYARKVLFEKIIKMIRQTVKNDTSTEFHMVDQEFLPVWQPDKEYNPLDRSLYQQFFQAPLPGILNQFDRCSMAYGVECRMPFLDYRIVEFIFSLPTESKVGKGFTKRILRKAAEGILPDEIRLNKAKLGFNAPIVDWFSGALKEWMQDMMSSKNFLESHLFNGKKIRKNFSLFIDSPNPQWDAAWQFWPPVHITWWLENMKNKLQS